MSFLQREYDRVQAALLSGEYPNKRDELMAAQQALSYALEPNGIMPPVDFILGIPAGSPGCSVLSCRDQFADTRCPLPS